MEPIGKLLRKRKLEKKGSLKSTSVSKKSLLSLEEQIAQLEKELDNSSDSSSDNGFDFDSEGALAKLDDSTLLVKDKDGNVIKVLSSIDVERIEPLPAHLLPSVKCSSTSRKASSRRPAPSTEKRTIRFADEVAPENNNNESISAKSTGTTLSNRSGLEATIKEMLRDYEPASREKKPFFCRLCKFQGGNLEELETHRLSEMHLLAIEVEKKVCLCRLCRKNFTSPDQLKEHLKGKAHKERMLKVSTNKRDYKNFC